MPAWRRLLSQFKDPLTILLLVATAISAGLWLHERDAALPYEAIAIFAVVANVVANMEGTLPRIPVRRWGEPDDFGGIAPMFQILNFNYEDKRRTQLNFGFVFLSRAGLVSRDDLILFQMLFHAGDSLGDSIYEARLFVRGSVAYLVQRSSLVLAFGIASLPTITRGEDEYPWNVLPLQAAQLELHVRRGLDDHLDEQERTQGGDEPEPYQYHNPNLHWIFSQRPTAGHLCSWAGMCPGNDLSAGKRRSGRRTQRCAARPGPRPSSVGRPLQADPDRAESPARFSQTRTTLPTTAASGAASTVTITVDGKEIDAKPGQKMGDGKLALEKLELRVEPKEEWRQMYVDAWRILRDWFYDPNMHGVDWSAMRDRYGRTRGAQIFDDVSEFGPESSGGTGSTTPPPPSPPATGGGEFLP